MAVNSGVSPKPGPLGVTLLVVLDKDIGKVTNAPLAVNSGVMPTPGALGDILLVVLDSVTGKVTKAPLNFIGVESKVLPVLILLFENLANSAILICKRRWHLNSQITNTVSLSLYNINAI